MKEILCHETNFSATQIQNVKPFIQDFGFEGGFIFYKIRDKNLTKIKSILGTSILKIQKI